MGAMLLELAAIKAVPLGLSIDAANMLLKLSQTFNY
jgi:hypothetical protein